MVLLERTSKQRKILHEYNNDDIGTAIRQQPMVVKQRNREVKGIGNVAKIS